MRISIVLADDHELVRESIASLLREEPEFDVVGQCAEGRTLLDLAGRLRPNVVVLDVAMPEMNGIEAAHRLREISPATRVIVLSNYMEEAYVRGMIEAGVAGYVVKSGAASDLRRAVRQGTRSNIYLSDEAAGVLERLQLAGDRRRGKNGGGSKLSKREREVLQLIAEGKSSKEIASRLGISETTVKSHRNKIMDKLNVRDTAGLTRRAIRLGLVRAE